LFDQSGTLSQYLTASRLTAQSKKPAHAFQRSGFKKLGNGRLPNTQPLRPRKLKTKLTTRGGLGVDKYHNLKDFLIPGLTTALGRVGVTRKDSLDSGVNSINLVINCYFIRR
jgi:hypothetical protein